MFFADSSITRDAFYRIRTVCGHTVGVQLDSNGFYIVFVLTDCCGAACKWTGDCEENAANVCKDCYRRMPDDYGEGNLVDQLRVAGCSAPEVCADDVLDIVDRLLHDDDSEC